MEYRTLGRSGLKISTICAGTMTFGDWDTVGTTDRAGAARQLDMCFDAGVNIVDTANVYSGGKSEEILGDVLSENGRRAKTLIATKVRFGMGEGPNDRGLSRYHIIEQCEASLRRLENDVIDLYQVHQWDGITPLEETLSALNTLVEHGKIRYIGCSNFSAWHVMKALAVSDSRLCQRFISQQIHYTLEAREAEYELVPLTLDQGLGILIWSPIAGGLLSGKYRRDNSPEGTRHAAGWKEPPIYNEDRLYNIIDVLVDIASSKGVSGAQVALAWALQRPGVTSVIIGGRTDEQFADNLGAANLKLTAEEVQRLDAVSQLNLIYPYWHQSSTAWHRFSEPDMALHRPYLKNGN
jgi:aryl-alcohol dehydrogenase-like predicted oxidoreductase